MTWKMITVELNGVLPTLMHNGQLADPTNKYAKAMKDISGKRKKTDNDFLELSRLEFLGSLYLDPNGHPCWPAINIQRCIQAGAKLVRKGKDVDAGILIDGDWPLKYNGPTDPEELFADERFVNRSGAIVNRSRIIRTRPQFPEWSIEFELHYMPGICNPGDIKKWCIDAGIYVGLSDWRPRYGRFEVTKFKEAK